MTEQRRPRVHSVSLLHADGTTETLIPESEVSSLRSEVDRLRDLEEAAVDVVDVDALIERVAKAIRAVDVQHNQGTPWDQLPSGARYRYLNRARSLHDAGFLRTPEAGQ
ncbi:hypothetical protein [Gordonia sp. NPDC003376]